MRFVRPLRLTACVGLMLGMAHSAHAADVEGQAQMPNHSAAREAVVYLEGAPRSVPALKAVVDQRDKMFVPHVSVVTRGTTIQFPNNDTVFHNVFAYFQAQKFDLGMYPRGASKSVKFDKTGVVALLCNVHSDMSAYIMIVDTPFYAVTDKQGHFHIPDVPPGEYTLHVWHESGAKYAQPLQVTNAPASLALALTRK